MLEGPKTCRSPLNALREAQVPDSVVIELKRSRRVLEASLSDEATDTLTENLVELRMLGADAHLLAAIVQRLSLLAPRLTGPGGLTAWLTAVREVAQQARLVHLLRALFDVAPALLAVEQGLATRRPFISNLGLHLPEAGRAAVVRRGGRARGGASPPFDVPLRAG